MGSRKIATEPVRASLRRLLRALAWTLSVTRQGKGAALAPTRLEKRRRFVIYYSSQGVQFAGQ
jgi:hypothetical protein